MRRLLLAAPVLAVVLGVAACGGADDSGIATAGGIVEDDGSGGGAEQSQEEQAQAFVDCMREQGIDMPDPDPNGGGGFAGFRDLDIPREELQPALEACRDRLDFGGQGGPPQLSPEQQEQRAEFSECMRENGIDMPDPDPNGGGFGLGGGDLDPNDPDFQAAIEACQDFLAGSRGGPRGPGGGQ